MPPIVETYPQAIEFLFSRINYERAQGSSLTARDFKLDRMQRLLELVGNPQDAIPAVHIAGTKGKGSTAAMVASILQAAGYRTGLFTSPHLTAFEERMRVDGRQPSPEELVDLLRSLLPAIERMDNSTEPNGSPTYFEIATALAWMHFTRQNVQIAVLEVGLGGRLDATNVCRPEACAITTISHDHTHLLGDTLDLIAAEKAGILKPGIPAVSGVEDPLPRDVIRNRAAAAGAPLYELGCDIQVRLHQQATPLPDETEPGPRHDLADILTPWSHYHGISVPLMGRHQLRNAAVALSICDLLRQRGWHIERETAIWGLGQVEWPLRFEILSQKPTVVVDVAHNCASISALITTLQTDISARRRILVLAVSRDKDAAGMVKLLAPEFHAIVATRYLSNPRTYAPAELAAEIQAVSPVPVHTSADPRDAWRLARSIAGPDDVICITGSFFLAAELRDEVMNSVPTEPDPLRELIPK